MKIKNKKKERKKKNQKSYFEIITKKLHKVIFVIKVWKHVLGNSMNYLVTISILFVIYMCAKICCIILKKTLGRLLNIIRIYFTFQCNFSSTSKLKL